MVLLDLMTSVTSKLFQRAEERKKRQCQIVEVVLNQFDHLIPKIIKWIDHSYLTKSKINEYAKNFNDLLDEYESIQNKAKRLNDLDINERFTKLHNCIKSLPTAFVSCYRMEVEKKWSQKAAEKQIKDYDTLATARDKIASQGEELRQALIKISD